MKRQTPFGPKLADVKAAQTKHGRVMALSCSVGNGTFCLKGTVGHVDPGQQELFDEMISFPNGGHDDLVDAAAMGVAHLIGKPDPRAITP